MERTKTDPIINEVYSDILKKKLNESRYEPDAKIDKLFGIDIVHSNGAIFIRFGSDRSMYVFAKEDLIYLQPGALEAFRESLGDILCDKILEALAWDNKEEE